MLLIIISQLSELWMTAYYKSNMLAHDAAIAGYLLANGVDEQLSGYEENTNNFLLPEIEAFQQKYASMLTAKKASKVSPVNAVTEYRLSKEYDQCLALI